MRPSPAWSAALLRPRAPSPRWTPPPPRSSTSSSSSSSPTSSSFDSRHGGGAAPRVERGTAGARRPAWSAALLRPRAPSPAGLLLLLAPRPRRRRPPPRPRPPPQLPTPQVLLHGARPEPRAGELTRNSSAWQHLGVGLVEVLRREQHLDVVVVVAVVVIAAIVVCVLERNGGRARGERARRVRCSDVST
jgi:hypothetical protein